MLLLWDRLRFISGAAVILTILAVEWLDSRLLWDAHESGKRPLRRLKRRLKQNAVSLPFWLLPFIALMIAGWLIWGSYEDRGNTVTIDFMSADGIVPGRTPVRYQGVEVGTVQDINLSKDLRKIEVRVSIKSSMKDALRKDTQFWLVTPKASLAGFRVWMRWLVVTISA